MQHKIALPEPTAVSTALLEAAARLCAALTPLRFPAPVAVVYQPLVYAAAPCRAYVLRWGGTTRRVVFLGMNPGPWGMAQVGVPFGDIPSVRDWLGLDGAVGRPATEHPAKPVRGFDCPRSEVSGRRLWGLFASRFGSPEVFFREHFVLNYCPLLFLDAAGRNLTPDKLPAAATAALTRACDAHLRETLAALQPEWLVGVGRYAAQQARRLSVGDRCRVAEVLHPSPASPRANRGWAGAATAQLEAQSVWKGSPVNNV